MAAIVLAGLLAAPASLALAFGPRTPSQIVDVSLGVRNRRQPACRENDQIFDKVLRPDGSEAPFSIPDGQVLVITAIELRGFARNPGEVVTTFIHRDFGDHGNHVATRISRADFGHHYFHIYQFNPGVVVASGGRVCVEFGDSESSDSLTGHLRGFLAPAVSAAQPSAVIPR
jgi:hypothetical protein